MTFVPFGSFGRSHNPTVPGTALTSNLPSECQIDQSSDECEAAIDRETQWRKDEERRKTRAEERIDADRKREERREQKQEAKEMREELAEAEEEQLDELKDREEQRKEECKEAYDKHQEDIQTSQEQQQEHEDTFYTLQKDITETETSIKERQVELSDKLASLKRDATTSIQDLKEQMGEEVESLEAQVNQLENSLSELQSKLDEANLNRRMLHLEKQKQDNEMYRKCFSEALKKVQLVKRNTKHKGISQLAASEEAVIRKQYEAQFNQILGMCLYNEVAFLNKQEQETEFQMRLQQNELMKKRIKQAISKVKTQVVNLQTNKKVTVLNKFKEYMQKRIQDYDESYDTAVNNFETFQQGQWTKINNIRKEQALALQRRSQAVPKDTRNALLANQCQQAEHMFNLFQQQQQGNQIMKISAPITRGAVQ